MLKKDISEMSKKALKQFQNTVNQYRSSKRSNSVGVDTNQFGTQHY